MNEIGKPTAWTAVGYQTKIDSRSNEDFVLVFNYTRKELNNVL